MSAMYAGIAFTVVISIPALFREIRLARPFDGRLVAAGRISAHRLPYQPVTGRPDILGVDVDEIRAALRPI